MRVTVLSASSATQAAPPEAAIAAGSLPTAIVVSTQDRTRVELDNGRVTGSRPHRATRGRDRAWAAGYPRSKASVRNRGSCEPRRGRRNDLRDGRARVVHRHRAASALVASASMAAPPTESPCFTDADRGSICETELSSRLATPMPPAPAEMSPGRTPTAI